MRLPRNISEQKVYRLFQYAIAPHFQSCWILSPVRTKLFIILIYMLHIYTFTPAMPLYQQSCCWQWNSCLPDWPFLCLYSPVTPTLYSPVNLYTASMLHVLDTAQHQHQLMLDIKTHWVLWLKTTHDQDFCTYSNVLHFHCLIDKNLISSANYGNQTSWIIVLTWKRQCCPSEKTTFLAS